MLTSYVLIVSAVLGLTYVLARASGLIRLTEKPNKVLDTEIEFLAPEGLDSESLLPNAKIVEYKDGQYRVAFNHKFESQGRISSEARISARPGRPFRFWRVRQANRRVPILCPSRARMRCSS